MSAPESFSVTVRHTRRLFPDFIIAYLKIQSVFTDEFNLKRAAIRHADRTDEELSGDTSCIMKPSNANYCAGSGAGTWRGRKERRHQSSSFEF